VTEIPIYPAGRPPEPPPEPGDWHGMFASLHNHLGRIAGNLPDPRRERMRRSQSVWSVTIDPVPVPLTSGAGVLDLPQLLGPGRGRNWAVHTISATGFTAGTVSGWVNVPVIASGVPAGALRAPFTAAGVLNFGKGQLNLRGGQDRLVFIAAGITGTVLISLEAIAVADEYWSDYLI
jgi:hypothetical protein